METVTSEADSVAVSYHNEGKLFGEFVKPAPQINIVLPK